MLLLKPPVESRHLNPWILCMHIPDSIFSVQINDIWKFSGSLRWGSSPGKRLMDQRRFRLWWKGTKICLMKTPSLPSLKHHTPFHPLPVVCICRSFTWSNFFEASDAIPVTQMDWGLGSRWIYVGRIRQKVSTWEWLTKLEQIPQQVGHNSWGLFFLPTGNRLPRRLELQEKGLRLVNRLVTTCERDVPWIEGQQRRLWKEKHLLVLNLVKSSWSWDKS